MKLVIGITVLLALANNRVHGGAIGEYGDTGEGHEDQLQNNYEHQENQGVGSDFGGQEHGLNEIDNQETQGGHAALEGHSGGAEGDNSDQQWQGGFQASEGIGGGGAEQDHSALTAPSGYGGESNGGHSFGNAGQFEGHGEQLSNIGGAEHQGYDAGNLAAHGINLGGHQFEGHHDEHVDLKPRVEVQHHHIPTRTIEHTKPVHINVVKKIGVPVPHPVGVPTPQIIKVPVPQPYAVHVPVPHPISVPIYKLVPQEIEKRVPIEVQKLIPVYVDKPYEVVIEKHHVEYVDKPYAVHVPVYKHIYHHVPKHGSGGHSDGH
ncbi:hypothetical protein JTB14_012092 [Gonioctena quinquepunctata]|nr:hypothetical protein JTB14_012092 [Gonioctena quinquepunctata]